MTIRQGTYYPAADQCAGAATAGAKALMSWYLGAYGARGATNLGIYGCRDIAGTTEPSVHGDGRADDLGCPVGNDWSWSLADWLRLNSLELGIQCIIHRRKIWSCNHGVDWRDYFGASAHEEHQHVEITPQAGVSLTVEHINTIARGSGMTQPDTVPYVKYDQDRIRAGYEITVDTASRLTRVEGHILRVEEKIDQLLAPGGSPDQAQIIAAVKQALREGTGLPAPVSP